MKKFLVAVLMWPLLVLAQSYPSPHFNNLTVDGTLNAGTIGLTNPLPVGSGGTGSSTATGATANLQYLGSGTGATTRSLASKLGDLVSVADFGAPTGTDDTTAFSNTAAAAIAGNSQAIANPGWPSPNWAFAYIPPGTYTLTAPVNVSNKSFVWYAAPGAVINGPQYLNGRLERIGSKVTSQSSGITDNATTFTIAANQNYDEQAQVSGFTNTNQLSAGNGRDTVALYIGNTLPPSVYTSASVTSYSATGATLSTPLTTTQLGQLRVGMIVTTQHTPQPYSGVLTAWTANSITVSNWYLVTGTSGGAPATPTGTNGLDINTFRKVWAVNGNAFIAPSSYGSAINTVEWGMSNTKGAPQSQSGSVEANGVYMTNLAGAGAYGGDAAFFASGGSLSGGGWTWGYKADGGVQVPFYYNGSVNPAVTPTWLLQGINPSNQTFFTAGPDGSLNLGPQGAANTTTISFHSGTTNTAYDSQINASGGTGTAGGGTLGLYASTLNLNASTVVNAGTTLRPSTDNAYGLGQPSFRWSSVNGVAGNFTNLTTSGTATFNGIYAGSMTIPSTSLTYTASGTGGTSEALSTVLGRTVNIDDYNAAGNGTSDDSTPLTNAMNALGTAGGTVMLSCAKNYAILSNVTIPANVTVQQCRHDAPWGNPGVDWATSPIANNPHINLSSSVSITLSSNSGLVGTILRSGMTIPVQTATAYAGTALKLASGGANDVQINALIIGFATCVDGTNGGDRQRWTLECDGNPASSVGSVIVGPSFDTSRMVIRTYPWGTVGYGGGSGGTLTRTGIGTQILSSNQDDTQFDIMDFGHSTALSSAANGNMHFHRIWADNNSTSSVVFTNGGSTIIDSIWIYSGVGAIFNGPGNYDISNFFCNTGAVASAQCLSLGSGTNTVWMNIANLDIETSTSYGINVGTIYARVSIGNAILRGIGSSAYIAAASGGTSDQIQIKNITSTDIAAGGSLIGGNANSLPSIASAASLPITAGYDHFLVTGTTSITSIQGSWNDRRIILSFSGALTVTNGTNLTLTGGSNFTTSAGSAIALWYDQPNSTWREMWRH